MISFTLCATLAKPLVWSWSFREARRRLGTSKAYMPGINDDISQPRRRRRLSAEASALARLAEAGLMPLETQCRVYRSP